jgi:voltage-gated potassium channel
MSGNRPRVRTWYERLTIGRAIATILCVAGVVMTAGAVLARIVEPKVFDNMGISFWWAITTITTVGYGDVVPTSTGGRLVGAMLMMTGLALIPTTTSVVITVLMHKLNLRTEQQDRRAREQEDERLTKIEETLEQLQRPPS